MMKLNVNHRDYEIEIAPYETLADVLYKKLGLIGVRHSCGKGECGSCTVLLDGKPVLSCILLAIQAEGKEILTIEGLGTHDRLHPIQEAFIEEHGFQCGFCTPGVILSATSLLKANAKPSAADVGQALSGHICRCGAYPKIINSVLNAAEKLDEDHVEE
jgi:carbon-monoxide dehydrogenase small subunit